MLKLVKKLYRLLGPRERRRFYARRAAGGGERPVRDGGGGLDPAVPRGAGEPGRIESNPALNAVYEGLGFATADGFLTFLGLAVLGLVIFSLGLRLASTYVIARFANMRAYSLSAELIENYLRQPYIWFLHRNSAHLSRIILLEVQRVVHQGIMPLMAIISQFALVLSLFGLLFVLEPVIALLAVGLFGGSYLLVFFAARRALARIGAVVIAANDERFKAVHEVMTSIKDVKILGVEKPFLARFRAPTYRMAMVESRSAVISETPRDLLQAIALGGMLVLILYLLSGRNGTLVDILPTLGVFAFAGLRLFPALQALYREFGRLKMAEPVVDELYADVMETRAQAMPWPKDRRRPGAAAARPARARRHQLRLSPGRPDGAAVDSTSSSPRGARSASSAAPAPARPRSST